MLRGGVRLHGAVASGTRGASRRGKTETGKAAAARDTTANDRRGAASDSRSPRWTPPDRAPDRGCPSDRGNSTSMPPTSRCLRTQPFERVSCWSDHRTCLSYHGLPYEDWCGGHHHGEPSRHPTLRSDTTLCTQLNPATPRFSWRRPIAGLRTRSTLRDVRVSGHFGPAHRRAQTSATAEAANP